MSTEIWIARHGETDWNKDNKWQGQSDVHLNENGLKQAQELAFSLKNSEIDLIFSSDLDRAHKTASIVAEHIGIDSITVDSRLRERNLGQIEGLTTSEIESMTGTRVFSISWNQMAGKLGIEPWDSVAERVWSALEEIGGSNSNKRVLVVAHGGVMRAVAQRVKHQEDFPFNFSNGELLKIMSSGDGWKPI